MKQTTLIFIVSVTITMPVMIRSTFGQKRSGSDPALPAQAVERKVDRFSGSTIVTLKPHTIADDPQTVRITMTAVYDPRKQGMDESTPRRVEITLTLNSLEPYFGRDERMILLVDGERLQPAPLAVGRDYDARQTIIHTGISLDALRRIGRGRSVEMKLGELEFALSDTSVKTLAEFARAVDAC